MGFSVEAKVRLLSFLYYLISGPTEFSAFRLVADTENENFIIGEAIPPSTNRSKPYHNLEGIYYILFREHFTTYSQKNLDWKI